LSIKLKRWRLKLRLGKAEVLWENLTAQYPREENKKGVFEEEAGAKKTKEKEQKLLKREMKDPEIFGSIFPPAS